MKKPSLFILAAVILFGVILCNLPASAPTDAPKPDSVSVEKPKYDTIHPTTLIEVYNLAADAIRQNLKDPDSAEFSSTDQKPGEVLYIGNGIYDVYSSVRSRNSFNAPTTTRFSARVIRSGENWEVRDVKFY